MNDQFDDSDDSLEALQRAGRRRSLVTVVITAVAVVAFLGVGGMLVADVVYPGIGKHVRGFIAGENDILGDPVYTPKHEVAKETLAEKVDLDRVHGELLPRWLAALSYDDAGYPSEQSVERLETLIAAVEADPNLRDIVTELGELMHSKEAAEKADRVLYLTFAWNDYLRQMEQPYHFEANMVHRRQGPMLYTKNYGLDAEVEFALGDERLTGLLASRIDSTNVVENYLCRATEADERVLWIVDTSATEAAEQVWPMLSSENDETLDPIQKAFADSVRGEAKRVLSAEAMSVLEKTAPLRQRMLQTVDQVNARECNKFRISYKPLIAYDSSRLLRHQARAEQSAGSFCPPITSEELRTLIDASDALTIASRDEGLEEALEELTALVARPRLVHEVRHRADEDRHFARELPMGCPGCKEMLSARAQAELSGYLAAVAFSDAPALGLYRACSVHETTATYHKRALEPLVTELARGQNCRNGPVENLQKKAERADVELFDRDEPINVVGAWPEQVEIGAF